MREAITTVFPASAITTEKPRYNHGKPNGENPASSSQKEKLEKLKKGS